MDPKTKEETKVVITGAAGGMGRTTAHLFAEVPGVELILVDHPKTRAALIQLSVDLDFKNQAVGHARLASDVTDATDVSETVDFIISTYSRIDVLVNLAGIPPQKFGAFVRTPIEQMREVLEVNFWGTLNWCHAVLPHMRSQGFGRIINTSSIAGHRGDAGNLAYAASKAGVESITKTLALEAPHNKDGEPLDITVNAVAPGGTDTPMIKTLPPKFFEEVKARVPFKRWGRPEEIAAVIKFLAFDAPQYINGAIIPIDGGWSAA